MNHIMKNCCQVMLESENYQCLPLTIRFSTESYDNLGWSKMTKVVAGDEDLDEKLMQRMLSCGYWCLGRKSWRVCLGWPLTSYCSLLQPNLFQ